MGANCSHKVESRSYHQSELVKRHGILIFLGCKRRRPSCVKDHETSHRLTRHCRPLSSIVNDPSLKGPLSLDSMPQGLLPPPSSFCSSSSNPRPGSPSNVLSSFQVLTGAGGQHDKERVHFGGLRQCGTPASPPTHSYIFQGPPDSVFFGTSYVIMLPGMHARPRRTFGRGRKSPNPLKDAGPTGYPISRRKHSPISENNNSSSSSRTTRASRSRE